MEDPKVRPGGPFIYEKIFFLYLVFTRDKRYGEKHACWGWAYSGSKRSCLQVVSVAFVSQCPLPMPCRKACQTFHYLSGKKREPPGTTLPGAHPCTAYPTPPFLFFFFLPGERGNRRAARFAAQVRSAQHGASGQKRRLALHSMASGANTMAICGQRLEKIGSASPLEGKKKGGLFFFRRSPRARARNFWSSACEPHSTVNDQPTTCQGAPFLH